MRVPSGKTVYLAGGAVLMGRVLIENVHDVKLLGRGIIDHSIKGGIRIANSRDVYVEGIVATQCATGGSENVTIRNVKSVSYYGWGDGMNVLRAITYYLMVSSAVTQMIVQLFMALVWDLKEVVGI